MYMIVINYLKALLMKALRPTSVIGNKDKISTTRSIKDISIYKVSTDFLRVPNDFSSTGKCANL